MSPTSRPGKHGTLYLFRVRYSPDGELCAPGEFSWTCWAYDEEHAQERWDDGNEDQGYVQAGRPTRVRA